MAKNKKQESGDTLFGEGQDFYLDPFGQLTINNVDSPIGLQCQEIIKAEMEIQKAKDVFDGLVNGFMETMQERGLTKITVLGKTIIYKEAKLSDPKIVIKGASEE